MRKRTTKDRDESAMAPPARRGAALRAHAQQTVEAALTKKVCNQLAEAVFLDEDRPKRASFLAAVKHVLRDYFVAKQSLDLEPMRPSEQRKLLDELLKVTVSFRRATGITEWGNGNRIPPEVWYRLRRAGFDDYILRSQLIMHPIARFDRTTLDAQLAEVQAHERVHGRIGIDFTTTLGKLLEALEGACRRALAEGSLTDRGGPLTKKAERITVCQLAGVHLRYFALYAMRRDSFTGAGSDEEARRKEFIRTAKAERAEFIRTALQAIGVTARRVEKILEEQDAEQAHNAPGWFFDHRTELSGQAESPSPTRRRGASRKPT